MAYLIDSNRKFVAAERTKTGKLRCKVPANRYEVGATITLRSYDTSAQQYIDTDYRVTGLGAEWTDRGYVIDSEDARSFGGAGQAMRVAGQGRVQYAYIAEVV